MDGPCEDRLRVRDLALPVFLLERILGDQWGLRLWSMLGIAFFSWAFITSLGATRPWMRLVQIILLAAALVSARPLQDWAFGARRSSSRRTWPSPASARWPSLTGRWRRQKVSR